MKNIHMKKLKYNKNKALFKTAQDVLVGGVNSPVRSFNYVGGGPIPIKRGKGSKIYDYDGNSYIDYVLSYGSLILGHAYSSVILGIKNIINSGTGFGATHLLEVALAEYIRDAVPCLEKIRFVSSGTEAVMGAIRLARGATGRKKIIKFENSYHGHADYLLAKAGSSLATLNLPASKGVPHDFTKHTIIAPANDRDFIDKIFKQHGKDIAAIIIEPVGGNKGVILPDVGFLRFLRAITKKYKTLLIFDEVITGFRFHFGSAAQYFGVRPDLICLGKIIGGGLPIGAYGGNKGIMNNLAPVGRVYQASTFSGNPVVMQAGLLTLKTLNSLRKDYINLDNMVISLVDGLKDNASYYKTNVSVQYFKNMFSISFKKKTNFTIFYKSLLKNGIYLAPSEHEANFVSFAHKKEDISKTKPAINKAFYRISRKG